jgi:hypothetical protein
MKPNHTIVRGGVVLGITPSLALTGWVLMRLAPDCDEALGIGVLRTRASYRGDEDGATALPPAERASHRARLVARLLHTIGRREPILAIARRSLEADAYPGDARVHGLVDALGAELDVPIVEVEPEALKVDDALRAEAEREAWIDDLTEDEIPEALHRHALEAVAAVRVAERRVEAVRLARQVVRRIA